MTTIDEYDARIANLQDDIADLEIQRAQAIEHQKDHRLGAESDYPSGALLFWYSQHTGGPRVAVKKGKNHWSVTDSTSVWSFEELAMYIADNLGNTVESLCRSMFRSSIWDIL